MHNLINNFIDSILKNPITIIFIVVIIIFSVKRILENRYLYKYISEKVDDINKNHDKSEFYENIKFKYELYSLEYDHASINTTTFVEEIISDLKYRSKYVVEKINSIKNSSSLCILFGVLGTFVGLSMLLLTVNTKDVLNTLPNTISSMQTAFMSSILGIIFSIIISIYTKSKDSEQLLVQLMLKVENILTSQTTHQKSEYMDEKVEEIKTTIKHISSSIKAIEKFDKISQDLTEFNDEFISGIKTLKVLLEGSESSINTFDQSIRKLDKQFSILNIRFNKLFNKYDVQEDISREMLFGLKESSKNISSATENQLKIKEYIKNINAGFALYENNTQQMLNKLIKHENDMTEGQKNLLKEKFTLDDSINSLSGVIEDFSLNIQSKLDNIFEKSMDVSDKLNMVFDSTALNDSDFNEQEDEDIESLILEKLTEELDLKKFNMQVNPFDVEDKTYEEDEEDYDYIEGEFIDLSSEDKSDDK